MKTHVLSTHVFELLGSLEQNLSSYTNEQKHDYLHQLRLDIKKIRAVFSFAEKIFNEKYDVSSLRPLFQNAGKIREIHINIDHLLEAPEHPQGLIPLLKEKENILVQEFLNDDSHYHKLISDFRQQVSFPEKRPVKIKVKKFFKSEIRKADKMLQNADSEGMHRYRIKIKRMLYVFEALSKKLRKKIKLKKGKINKLQKKLGKWHDTYAAVEFYSHEDFSTKAPEYISDLKEKEIREFKTLLESLSISWKTGK